jgi:hypothetical protein
MARPGKRLRVRFELEGYGLDRDAAAWAGPGKACKRLQAGGAMLTIPWRVLTIPPGRSRADIPYSRIKNHAGGNSITRDRLAAMPQGQAAPSAGAHSRAVAVDSPAAGPGDKLSRYARKLSFPYQI